MNKRLDWFLYTPPEIWQMIVTVGMLQAFAKIQPNFFTDLALADVQVQLEGFLAVRKAFWENVNTDDYTGGKS